MAINQQQGGFIMAKEKKVKTKLESKSDVSTKTKRKLTPYEIIEVERAKIRKMKSELEESIKPHIINFIRQTGMFVDKIIVDYKDDDDDIEINEDEIQITVLEHEGGLCE
jgi:hypothetical protein